MRKELTLSLLLLTLIVLSILTPPASATDYTKVGVKVGDIADYSCTIGQLTERIRIRILQITGTNVTIEVCLISNIDGSEEPIDIITGNLSANTGTLINYLVAANLGKGDTAIPGRPEYTIDNTTTVIITGLNRTVNHSCHYAAVLPYGREWVFEYYWDKATGLAAKINRTTWSTGPIRANDSWSRSLFSNYTATLISTTAFTTQNTGQDPVTLLVSASAVTIVLATIAIAAITQKKHPNRH